MTTPPPKSGDMPDVIWAQDHSIHDAALPYWHIKPIGTCHSYIRTEKYQSLLKAAEGMEFNIKLIKSWFVDADIHTKDVNAWMKNGADLCEKALSDFQKAKGESNEG
jgi:hypothetical protein